MRLLTKHGAEYDAANPFRGHGRGPADLAEAARAWVKGEIDNIAMYDEMLEVVKDFPDITRVFTNLRRASLESHLPAFECAAEHGGILPPRDASGDEVDCAGGEMGRTTRASFAVKAERPRCGR